MGGASRRSGRAAARPAFLQFTVELGQVRAAFGDARNYDLTT
jgi:hypothetical protein